MAKASMADIVRNAKPGGFTEVPQGVYEAVVSNVTFKPTRNGDPMFVPEFTIDDDSDQEGRKLWRNISITENSVGFALNDLLLLGSTQEDVAEAVEDDNDAAIARVCGQMIDTRVRIFVRPQAKGDYKGKSEIYKIESLEEAEGEEAAPAPAPARGAAKAAGKSGPKAPF